MNLINQQLAEMFMQLMQPLKRPTGQKSDVIAGSKRKLGNDLFKKRKFKHALEFYNESLRYTARESQEAPLVYGNRSAVYCEMGKYSLALENIALARKYGYPDEKMAQLDDREQKCLKLMKEAVSEPIIAKSFFKLSHPPNEKIPFIAGCLEMRRTKKYGRGIFTNKDLKAGDIIAIEPPAMAWINETLPGTVCFYCTKANDGNLFPCFHCTNVMYCSDECQEKSMMYHLNQDSFILAYSGAYKNCLKMVLENIRVAGGVNEAVKFAKGSEGKTIFDFDFSNPSDPDYGKNMLMALNGLSVYADVVSKANPDELLDVPPFNEKPRTGKERKQLLNFIYNQFRIYSSNMTVFKATHHGIFVVRSLMNHSCVPDVECTRIGENVVLIMNHPVKAGNQIFGSYGVYAATHPKKERLLFLQEHPFKCDCVACSTKVSTPFPRKDRSFIEPDDINLKPATAIEHFKKNCEYINQNSKLIPCFEIAKLLDHNLHLVHTIAGTNDGDL